MWLRLIYGERLRHSLGISCRHSSWASFLVCERRLMAGDRRVYWTSTVTCGWWTRKSAWRRERTNDCSLVNTVWIDRCVALTNERLDRDAGHKRPSSMAHDLIYYRQTTPGWLCFLAPSWQSIEYRYCTTMQSPLAVTHARGLCIIQRLKNASRKRHLRSAASVPFFWFLPSGGKSRWMLFIKDHAGFIPIWDTQWQRIELILEKRGGRIPHFCNRIRDLDFAQTAPIVLVIYMCDLSGWNRSQC